MTPQQVAHFHTLGFVQCRKLFSPREMRTLSDAFDAAMSRARGGAPPPGPGDKRQQVAPFFDHDPQAFYPLLDDERLVTAFETLMGDDFILLESEGLLHTEGSRWHHDARAPTGLFSMRAAIYLDPLEPGDGCLDIIPGSHFLEFGEALTRTRAIHVNCVQNTTPERNPEHFDWLIGVLEQSTRARGRLYSDRLIETAGPRRRRMLARAIELGYGTGRPSRT